MYCINHDPWGSYVSLVYRFTYTLDGNPPTPSHTRTHTRTLRHTHRHTVRTRVVFSVFPCGSSGGVVFLPWAMGGRACVRERVRGSAVWRVKTCSVDGSELWRLAESACLRCIDSGPVVWRERERGLGARGLSVLGSPSRCLCRCPHGRMSTRSCLNNLLICQEFMRIFSRDFSCFFERRG